MPGPRPVAGPSAIPIALCCNPADTDAWRLGLHAALPQADIRVWPQPSPGARTAVVWSPTQEFMDAHPDLRLIFNMGAGVDALMRLRLPRLAQVVRIEDGGMAVQMADYVCHALLRHFREFDVYADSAAQQRWAPRPPRRRQDFPVGVMGLGALGQRVARSVAAFDFPVFGWSQSAKSIDGVQCLAGAAQLDDFLARTRVLVCLLPLTPATQDILNHRSLSRLKPGGYLINVARGSQLVEEDLLRLIDEGHMAGATLDVTRQEPLPAGHAFWTHPKIVLTPHVSAQTLVHESIAQISEKVRSAMAGEPLRGVVDTARGY
ncbi:glyoxylate/hydroxypyruvate reductase A [Xylophilus sp. Kf1]|nr:glyoxylate/hydroxypyruvate reductase A [Xylophilus sp. Kf1]